MQKNKEGKLIIIYAKDERSGIPYATLLSQKGFDNIYFLSGGIDDFAANFPEFCNGSGVEQLINEKLQQEILQREGKLPFYLYLKINIFFIYYNKT